MRGLLRLITAFVLSAPLLLASLRAPAQSTETTDIPLEDQFEVMLDALLAGDDPFDQLPQSAADILRYAEGYPSRAYFPEAYGAHLYSLSQQLLRSVDAGEPMATRGFDFLKLSALTGFAPAQLDLGARLALGDGLEQDPAQARLWFEQAGQSGLRDAQFNLALAAASSGVPIRPMIQNIVTRPAEKNSCCTPAGIVTRISDRVLARLASWRRKPPARMCRAPSTR